MLKCKKRRGMKIFLKDEKKYLPLRQFWFAATRLIGNPVKIRDRPATVIPKQPIDKMSLSVYRREGVDGGISQETCQDNIVL